MVDPRTIFKGKKITVMGLGLLGRGLGDTLFLVRCGARVTVTDLKSADQLAPSLKKLEGLPVTIHVGGHDEADFVNADMILRNADVPRSSKFLKIAAEHDVPIEMDESLFCKNFNGEVVGITGTRGKTTTTTLIHKMLSETRSRVFLAGNIMGQATLPLLEIVGKEDTVVLELSSWQLQGFHDAKLSPSAAVFTNIYPDHLNRYADMDEYIHDKKAIFLYQKAADFCIFNGDQAQTIELAEEAPAGKSFFSTEDCAANLEYSASGQAQQRKCRRSHMPCSKDEGPGAGHSFNGGSLQRSRTPAPVGRGKEWCRFYQRRHQHYPCGRVRGIGLDRRETHTPHCRGFR